MNHTKLNSKSDENSNGTETTKANRNNRKLIRIIKIISITWQWWIVSRVVRISDFCVCVCIFRILFSEFKPPKGQLLPYILSRSIDKITVLY